VDVDVDMAVAVACGCALTDSLGRLLLLCIRCWALGIIIIINHHQSSSASLRPSLIFF
jgi:hypothetical protein